MFSGEKTKCDNRLVCRVLEICIAMLKKINLIILRKKAFKFDIYFFTSVQYTVCTVAKYIQYHTSLGCIIFNSLT